MSNDATLVPTRATGKKSSPPKVAKAAPPAPTQPPLSEGDQLALQAAVILQNIVLTAPRYLRNTHIDEAERLLDCLLTPGTHERDYADPEDGDIAHYLGRISAELEAAIEVMERGIPGFSVDAFLIRLALVSHAFHYADQLFAAYHGLPGTLEELRTLTTQEGAYAGIKRHRDPPQPPIRRVEAKQYPLTQEQYKTVLEVIAGRSSTLCQLLYLAQGLEDPFREAIAIDAAQAIATQIGAMADTAVECDVHGDADRWNYGPNFKEAGKGDAA